MTKADKTNAPSQRPSAKPPTQSRPPRLSIFLQPTGGAGKTTVAALIAQAINEQPGRKALPIDIDPESPTLSTHRALNPLRFDVMTRDGEEIDQIKFNGFFDRICDAPEQGYTDVIVDAGSAGFRGLYTWLVTQNPFGYLSEHGWEVRLHYVIPGNGRKKEAYDDLIALFGVFREQFVIWLNPIQEECYFGGHDFTELDLYKQHQERITVVRLRKLNGAFQYTLMRALETGLTLAEVAAPNRALCADIMAVAEGRVPNQSGPEFAKLPPGLQDRLAPTRAATIKQWVASALAEAPGAV